MPASNLVEPARTLVGLQHPEQPAVVTAGPKLVGRSREQIPPESTTPKFGVDIEGADLPDSGLRWFGRGSQCREASYRCVLILDHERRPLTLLESRFARLDARLERPTPEVDPVRNLEA